MTTDAKHVENLAGLPEVKSLMPERSTAAESAMSPQRDGSRLVSRFEQARGLPEATRREIARTSQCQCTRSTCKW